MKCFASYKYNVCMHSSNIRVNLTAYCFLDKLHMSMKMLHSISLSFLASTLLRTLAINFKHISNYVHVDLLVI